MTFVVPSCTWYKQLIVHIDAPILAFNHNHKIGYPLKASFAKVNSSLTPDRPLRMPSAKANQPFVPIIHPNAISRS